MRFAKWWIVPLMLAATLLTAAGCNTAEGFGRDMESGGRAIKEEAQEHH